MGSRKASSFIDQGDGGCYRNSINDTRLKTTLPKKEEQDSRQDKNEASTVTVKRTKVVPLRPPTEWKPKVKTEKSKKKQIKVGNVPLE
ncbi:hypothetical protein CDAR_301891 [Caerostris darwini]|uniref:Uncharacterized protein n=1 Tax=Caerostris darwini TaxID=1538125 RepID=A0AAV4UGV2_9ARAC|nr:hypothetical protein CDAR_301891 [Caerostris darwini]